MRLIFEEEALDDLQGIFNWIAKMIRELQRG